MEKKHNTVVLMNTHLRHSYFHATYEMLQTQPIDLIMIDSGDNSEPQWNCIKEMLRKQQWAEFIEPPAETIWCLHERWNKGIEKALELGYKYICLTDEGILLSADFFKNMEIMMEKHPEFGLSSCLHQAGRTEQYFLEEDKKLWELLKFRYMNLEECSKSAQEAVNQTTYDWVTASWVESHIRIVRSEIFKKIKEQKGYYLYPKVYIGWYWDTQLCHDIWQMGYKVAICQKAFLWHYRDLFYGLEKKTECSNNDIISYNNYYNTHPLERVPADFDVNPIKERGKDI